MAKVQVGRFCPSQKTMRFPIAPQREEYGDDVSHTRAILSYEREWRIVYQCDDCGDGGCPQCNPCRVRDTRRTLGLALYEPVDGGICCTFMPFMEEGRAFTEALPIKERQILAWQGGAMIRDAMPELSRQEREWFTSGMSREEWEKIKDPDQEWEEG